AKTKNRPPKNIKPIPSNILVKSNSIHRNVKKPVSGGRIKIRHKKSNLSLFISPGSPAYESKGLFYVSWWG
ncbi:MAG: hypothetical protein VX186_02215, partial [Nitrospinota bacterium]|nr:hypothetical protein [Nitrospinota bacterium]